MDQIKRLMIFVVRTPPGIFIFTDLQRPKFSLRFVSLVNFFLDKSQIICLF